MKNFQKSTLIFSLAMLLIGLTNSAQAVCNTEPELEFVTDGTEAGTFAVIYWNACDGNFWEICTKGEKPSIEIIVNPGIASAQGGIPIENCNEIENNFLQIPYGGTSHILIHWLDGNQAGTRHLVHFDWPAVR
jgi:hypothetical protein